MRALFSVWGKDGLKLVLAALQANPSLSKPDKAANLEAAKKLFQSGRGRGNIIYYIYVYMEKLYIVCKGVSDIVYRMSLDYYLLRVITMYYVLYTICYVITI
jgi:hypothetical protein